MRWKEAIQVALCYGWGDSTVKSLDKGNRRQYLCPRKPKSVWSKVNKEYIQTLKSEGLMHQSGYEPIRIVKENGSWNTLADVEAGIVPKGLQTVFDENKKTHIYF